MSGSDYKDWNQSIIDEFRSNDGNVTSVPFGRGLVLVHHTGAKTGTERVSPVANVHPDPDTWLIAASKAGAPENPAWYHNLLAHPETKIETPDEGVVEVEVTELTGAERDDAWERFKAMSPGFGEYEAKTDRVIPVLALRRR